jgi:hypothetical protein
MRARLALAGALAAAVVLGAVGCQSAGSAGHHAAPTPSVLGLSTSRSASGAASSSHGPCAWRVSTTYRHVIWIWMENRTYTQVLGSGGSVPAPHTAWYTQRCGLATDYLAVTHPSLPNYLAAVQGGTGGVTSDCGPSSCPQRSSSLFGQVRSAGKQWRGYAESMSRKCDTAAYGDYAPKHNPAVYFSPIRSLCLQWDVAMGGTSGVFAYALSHRVLPAFAFVTPNLCDDGHDCTTTTADRWLGTWLDRISTSAAYLAGDVLVVVTWDEGVGTNQRVATVVIGPTVPAGLRVGSRLDHYSLLRTTEELLGLPLLGHAAGARSMRTAFHL